MVHKISCKKITNIQDFQSIKLNDYFKSSTLVVTLFAIGLLISFSIDSGNDFLVDFNSYAQSEEPQQTAVNNNTTDRVSIKVDSVKFSPLTNSGINQLKVDITYQTNDPKLVNTIMAGVMKVYTTDGTLIKTSTIPSGYILGQAGPMQFATSIQDETIQNVKAEIVMTDKSHLEKISNTLTIEAMFEK